MKEKEYTTERVLRQVVAHNAAVKGGGDPRVIERWTRTAIEATRKRGLLLTEQQFADHRAGRELGVGDQARYVGPARDEQLEDGRLSRRPHGQEGYIASVEDGLLTFVPNDGSAALVVRRGTRGALDLERKVTS